MNQIIQLSEEVTEASIKAQYKVNEVINPKFNAEYEVWEIPGEYLTSFRQNPEKAKRDFGATPSQTLTGFFPSAQVLMECYNMQRKNPVTAPGKYNFHGQRPLRVPYYIHVDIGLNKDGRGDYTGFCMGHFGGWETDVESGELRMIFYIDLLEKIGATLRHGEVEISEIRDRIYELQKMGYSIKLVTFDGFQSKDTIQILRKKGIRADYLSVDKIIDPYNTLKSAVNEKRLDVPYIEELNGELSRLELIKGIKIDHPPGGSKDLADALAGVVYNIEQNTASNTIHMAPSSGPRDPHTPIGQHLADRQKILRYQFLQRMTDKQTDLENKRDLDLFYAGKM